MAKHTKAQRNHKYSLHSRQRKVNRKYKDTIFRMLFKDRNNLLSLYNAMNKKNYTDASALQVVTLENAIYLGMKNDLAFIMDMNLYLYEHQSTYNPNMPLRDLFYISNEYQKMVVQQSLYSSTIQKIPAPKFIVFYNGTKEINDLTEFRLSSAYECPTEDPDLELRVTVLNVNDGHNKALMEQCQTLKEYAQYVARVRKYVSSNELSLEEAVEKAVTECINENILRDFLSSNRAEVINMIGMNISGFATRREIFPITIEEATTFPIRYSLSTLYASVTLLLSPLVTNTLPCSSSRISTTRCVFTAPSSIGSCE